jgi:hypothetical protein
MMDLNVAIGALIVFLVACYRFNAAPPAKPCLPEGLPRLVGTVKTWFQWREEPASALFPPPRANTTLFKFWLYRVAYTCTGLAIFGALYAVPGLADELQKIINLAGGPETPILRDAGPVVMAFLVVAVFPEIPPLKGADRTIRRLLYERAAIPAQQLSELNRLKEAPYKANPEVLGAVRKKLAAEGFEEADLVYEATPTVRSLWTKASLLMAHLARWRGKDRYKTAFAVLRERDSDKLSVERISEAYEALKGDAKVCLRALRTRPSDPETEGREAAFRRDCKELLWHIYNLLSRVSLKSHFTDRERVRRMAELGFSIEPREGGPTPDPNDLVALALVLGAVLIVPLSRKLGVDRALLIGVITYTVVLLPIVLASRWPEFALKPGGASPALAFPVVAAVLAVVIGILFSVASNSIGLADPGGGPPLDFARGWAKYTGSSYPWSTLHALLAFLVAWRIRTGAYPDPTRLKGLARYQEWGNLWDAGIFVGCVGSLMVLFVRPRLAELWGNPAVKENWGLVLIPVLVAFAMGFFVPTWHRANLLRMAKATVEVQPVLGEATVTP